MEKSHGKGAASVIFLAGVVAGGVAALLFAPQTGAQMRSRLRRGASDIRDKGVKLAHTVDEKVGSVAGAVKGAASEARSTYRDEMEKSRTAAGVDTKRDNGPETVGARSRTGEQS